MIRPLGVRLVISLTLVGLVACGDDEGPTSPSAPTSLTVPGDAATVQLAVDRIAPGGTITIADGIYPIDATVTIPADKEGLTITGSVPRSGGGPSRPVLDLALDASEDDGLTAFANGVTIAGLELRGTFRDGVLVADAEVTITDCLIVGALQNSISCVGSSADVTIERNYLIGPGRFGVASVQGATPFVVRNTIVDAGDCGFYSNNTAPAYTANIVVGSSNWGIACFGSASPTLSCNVLFENGGGDYSAGCDPGEGDRQADPEFCETLTYTLAPGSPCIGDDEGCGWVGASEIVCGGR